MAQHDKKKDKPMVKEESYFDSGEYLTSEAYFYSELKKIGIDTVIREKEVMVEGRLVKTRVKVCQFSYREVEDNLRKLLDDPTFKLYDPSRQSQT